MAAAPAPTYPVSARLTLAPRDRQQCLLIRGEPADCGAIEVIRAEFAAAVSRMFQQGSPPALELVLQVRTAETSNATGRLEIDLSSRVTISTPAGQVIDEIDSSGTSFLLVVERGPIAIALRDAARQLALDFEQSYREDRKVADYLVGAKVAPVSAVAAEERSDRLTTLSAGLGVVDGGDNSFAVAPSLEVSVASKWLFARVGYAHSAPTFVGISGQRGDADLSTNDFWLEAGGVYRFTPSAEVRLGVGPHFMLGNGSLGATSQDFSLLAPAIAGSITKSFAPFRTGPRLVAGLEARGFFFSSVALPSLFRSGVPAAKASLLLTFGVEIPWAGEKAGQR